MVKNVSTFSGDSQLRNVRKVIELLTFCHGKQGPFYTIAQQLPQQLTMTCFYVESAKIKAFSSLTPEVCVGLYPCAQSEVCAAAAAAKSLQSCPTLCDPIDSSPPGSTIPGMLQARTLEWVAISFSNAWKWKGKVKLLSHVWLFMSPWTAAYQAPLSMGFSRQEYRVGCHCLLS